MNILKDEKNNIIGVIIHEEENLVIKIDFTLIRFLSMDFVKVYLLSIYFISRIVNSHYNFFFLSIHNFLFGFNSKSDIKIFI